MKILDITPRFPYPLTDGALICMYQSVVALHTLGHQVCLVSLDDSEAAADYGGAIRKLAELHVIPYKPAYRVLGALGTLFSQWPYTQLKKDLRGVRELLDQLQETHRFDAVFVDEIHIAQYGAYMKSRHGLPYLLRCHNIEYEIYRRHTATVRNPLMRWYLGLQTRRWERFEVSQWSQADVCAAITERDRAVISGRVPSLRTSTVPAAVDLDAFAFTDAQDREPNSVIVLGNMSWAPNRDAAVWFANQILPLIAERVPDIICYLVGSDPPLKELPTDSGHLRIEGRVGSIDQYYRRVTMGLIPLRVGGGMRVKMVEMMSSGLPIVSTGQGAEGNEAVPGEHYLRADDSVSFADAVVRLLGDAAERRRLARAARNFVAGNYSLEGIGNKYNELLREITGDRRNSEGNNDS